MARAGLKRLLRREEGQALVEFALILPVLVVLLFGVIEFGKLFNYWLDEGHLANTGARYAVVNSNPGGGGVNLQSYIKSQGDTAELRNNAHVCITFPSGTSNVGDPVKVKVQVTSGAPIVGGLINTFFGGSIPGSITVSGSSTMRLEVAPTNYVAGDGGTGACS